MAVNDGGPAFPFHREWENERKGYTESESSSGMSLRDYFAAQSLASFQWHGPVLTGDAAVHLAQAAYLIADAMLESREQK